MLTQIAYQVGMLKTMLSQVDSGSFTSLINFIVAARKLLQHPDLGRPLDGVATLSRIDADYTQLYPPGPAACRDDGRAAPAASRGA